MTNKTYQELVDSVLSNLQADIERGLAQAREQKSFINQVADKLSRNGQIWRMTMSDNFIVTFTLEPSRAAQRDQIKAVAQALAENFDVEESGLMLYVVHKAGFYDCCIKCRSQYDY